MEESTPPTITLPPPNFTVFLMHWGDKCFPFLRLKNLLPSDPNKLNLDSSLKWTIFHCSSVQTICSVAKSRQNFLFCFEIKGLWLIFPYLTYEKQFFKRLAFLFAHKMHIAVSKRSFKDILTIIQSSLVIRGGLPVLGFWFKCLVSLKSTDYMITLFDHHMMPAISEYDLPSSWFATMSFFLLELNNYMLKNISNDVWQLTINQN